MAVNYPSLPPVFQTSTKADQIGINAAPSTALNNGFIVNATPNAYGLTNLLIKSTDQNICPLTVQKTHTQTQRGYDTTTFTGNGHSALILTDVDNNDNTFTPASIISRGLVMNTRVGHNAPSYGSGLGIYQHYVVENSGSATNEFAGYHGYVQIGTAAAPTNARNWGFLDYGVYGPVGLRPEIFGGGSLVVKNLYNGSPSVGPSAGLAIQNFLTNGPGGNVSGATNNYPVDFGICVTGKATGDTGDAFTYAFVAGGQTGYWTGEAAMAGDQGQVGVGFYVKARNDGTTPCTRLGGYVSPGLGEAGGLIFGTSNGDANRVSIYRPSNGNMSLRGSVAISGTVGFNGTTPPAKPAVTGSRGGNAALASLLTALASLGLLTDSTTA